MTDIIYYIFAFLIILSSMVIAFSNDLKRIVLFSASAVFSFAAMLILHKAQLLAMGLLALTGISVMLAAFHFHKQAALPSSAVNRRFKLMLFPVLALSAATAIITSLSASTRWVTKIDSSYDYSLIFSAYLPVILLVLLLASAVIRFISGSFRKESQT